MQNTAPKTKQIAEKVIQAPVTEALTEKVQGWYGPKFLLGPLVVDLGNNFKEFAQNHNRFRNLLHAAIIIVTAVLSLVFSQTSQEFRNFLNAFSVVFQLSNQGQDLNDFYYLYVAYMFSTGLASVVSNVLFDLTFICLYGDREFHLSQPKKQALAAEFNTTPQEVQATFHNTLQQLRKGHFTSGARKEDLHEVLKALQNKDPAAAKQAFETHAAALNATLDQIEATPHNQHLFQYRKTIAPQAPTTATSSANDPAPIHPVPRADMA